MTPSQKENHNIPSQVDLATEPPIMTSSMKSRECTFGMTRHSTPKIVRFSSVGQIAQEFEKTLNPVPESSAVLVPEQRKTSQDQDFLCHGRATAKQDRMIQTKRRSL